MLPCDGGSRLRYHLLGRVWKMPFNLCKLSEFVPCRTEVSPVVTRQATVCVFLFCLIYYYYNINIFLLHFIYLALLYYHNIVSILKVLFLYFFNKIIIWRCTSPTQSSQGATQVTLWGVSPLRWGIPVSLQHASGIRED